MKYVPTEALEQRANDVLTSLNAYDLPVPLEVVAHRLGLVVERVPLGEGISGVLVVSEGRGRIGVNSEQPTVRQRFTIAHEIGHFLLHREDSDLFIDKTYVAFRDSESAKGEERAEIQANQFAAALLMPAQLVQRELSDELVDLAATDTIDQLAARFGVSVQSMAFRLENLGLMSKSESD